MRETWVQTLGPEDPLEKEMATHSSTLAWEIPWMEEPAPGHGSSTGLSVKRCPGIGFLSRADRGIGVFQHVLPPMKLRLKYSR